MMRPNIYNYYDELVDHLGGDVSRVFDGTAVWPRQLEIHLPGDHKRPCDFNCPWCQGRLLNRALGRWEGKALNLIDKLEGEVPYHIYGGAYTEPLLNPYLLDFLRATKRHGSHFGIHTNGSLLLQRQANEMFLEEACAVATSSKDYISISLDAGTPESHTASRGLKSDHFNTIMDGLRMAKKIRGDRAFPSLRIVYLMTKWSATMTDVQSIVDLASDIKVDSLRFSIPYDLYGKDFSVVRKYKQRIEDRNRGYYFQLINPYLSMNGNKRPHIFWISPDSQDVDAMRHKQCIYSYFQITLAADGHVYRCSSTATPSFKFCRLGKITDNLEKFKEMIKRNHNLNWDPGTCFSHGARCNRMALEVNREWGGRQ